MRNKISYEWVAEEHDDNGDIIDPMFSNALTDALHDIFESQHKWEIALVRNIGNNSDGLVFREYAYIEENHLPELFESGYKIPKKYHKEVNRIYGNKEY